ncbi:hypothetical protein, partial [Petrachloros mirabilis]
VNADSQFGVNGTVTIQSPYSQLGSKLSQLPQNPLVSAALVNQRCAAIAQGEVSSFIVAGRDTLPSEPGGWLTSPYAALQTGTGQRARGEGETQRDERAMRDRRETQEASGIEVPILSLRHLTPTGFLMRHFAESETAGCRS